MTLFEIIFKNAQKSKDVFLYNFDFGKKSENVNLSIKQMRKLDDLYSLNCYPFNVELNLNILEFSKSKVDLFGELVTFYGLCCKNNGKLLFQHIFQNTEEYRWKHNEETNLKSIIFNDKSLNIIECDYALTIAYCLLSLLDTYQCYNLIFLQYLIKCFLDFSIYNDSDLKMFFLITFSETQTFNDAINHTEIKKIGNRRGLALKNHDMFISDIFKEVYLCDSIKNFISHHFHMKQSEVSLLINDIYIILKSFESGL